MTPERREEIRKRCEEIAILVSECSVSRYGHENCTPNQHVEQFALDVWDEALEAAEEEFPDTWLDPLLSGKNKVIFKSPCQEIENLISEMEKRIRLLKAKGER